LELGELAGLARAAQAFDVAGLVIGASHQSGSFELVEAGELFAPPISHATAADAGTTGWLDECEELARLTRHADLLLHRRGQWAACHTTWRPAVEEMFSLFQQRTGSPRPLAGRRVLLLGTSAVARAIAHAVRKQAATVEVSGRDSERVRMMAEFLGCRARSLDRLHLAQFHVLVCTEPGPGPDGTWPGLHEALRDDAVVLDISRLPCETALLREATARRCVVLDPLDVLLGQVDLYVQALTGQQPTLTQLVESAAMLKLAATAEPPPASVERVAAPVTAPPEPPSPVLRALEEDQPGGGKSLPPASASLRDVLPYLADAGTSLPEIAPLSPEEEMPVRESAHIARQPLAATDTYGVEIKEPPAAPPPRSKWWIIRAGRMVINWVWLGWVMLLVASAAYAAVWLWAEIARILFP
jgi:shikimate 5-dehydrogenase